MIFSDLEKGTENLDDEVLCTPGSYQDTEQPQSVMVDTPSVRKRRGDFLSVLSLAPSDYGLTCQWTRAKPRYLDDKKMRTYPACSWKAYGWWSTHWCFADMYAIHWHLKAEMWPLRNGSCTHQSVCIYRFLQHCQGTTRSTTKPAIDGAKGQGKR